MNISNYVSFSLYLHCLIKHLPVTRLVDLGLIILHTSQLRCALRPEINYKHTWHPFQGITDLWHDYFFPFHWYIYPSTMCLLVYMYNAMSRCKLWRTWAVLRPNVCRSMKRSQSSTQVVVINRFGRQTSGTPRTASLFVKRMPQSFGWGQLTTLFWSRKSII